MTAPDIQPAARILHVDDQPDSHEWLTLALERKHYAVTLATDGRSALAAFASDRPDVVRFSKRTSHFETCDAARIAALEPDLETRFPFGLFFPGEAMLAPREATITPVASVTSRALACTSSP